MIQVGPSKAHGSYKGKKPCGSEAVAGDVTWTQGSEKGAVGRDRPKDAELLALTVQEGAPGTRNVQLLEAGKGKARILPQSLQKEHFDFCLLPSRTAR